LRDDIESACAAGRFSIWPIETIDQGIELLAGRPAGEQSADGTWPEGSVNRAVVDRLRAFADTVKESKASPDEETRR
jgi:predicted ATP-dependent protease